MNISQHVILPNKWKFGRYLFDGSQNSPSSKWMTHWYPVDTTGHTLFYLQPDAQKLYGLTFGYSKGIDTYEQLLNFMVLDKNYNVFDGSSPETPSKPFTYILIK